MRQAEIAVRALCTQYEFKSYPHWNELFYGRDKAALPESCEPWLAKSHKEGALPKAIRAGRDRLRAYWKTLCVVVSAGALRPWQRRLR